jgi:hypothetical protein
MEVASGEYGSYVEKLSEAVKENPDSIETSSNSKNKRLVVAGDEIQIEIAATKDDNSDCHNSLLVRMVSLSLSLSLSFPSFCLFFISFLFSHPSFQLEK